MRIVKLAAGLAAGYVLGARAGREKYEQLVATARKLSDRRTVAQAQPEATPPSEPEPISPLPDPVLIEQLNKSLTTDKRQPSRSQRASSGTKPITPNTTDDPLT